MPYDWLVVIVSVNALVTLSLWWALRRYPANFNVRPKKKLARALWDAEPIKPKHERPRPTQFPYPGHHRFFVDFAEFADVVNWWLADDVCSPWRLQELPETDVSRSVHGPVFGRTYAAFYNQIRLGTVCIDGGMTYVSASQTIQEANTLTPEDRFKPSSEVSTNIELKWVRLLGHAQVTEFLCAIAMHITDYRPGKDEHRTAQHSMHAALLQALWENQRPSEFGNPGEDWGELDVSFRGTPLWFLGRRDCEAYAAHKRTSSTGSDEGSQSFLKRMKARTSML
jgi:hypothetical protein